MGFIYSAAKRIYRLVANERLSHFLFSGQSFLSRFVLSIKARMEASASHDQLYDDAYFRKQDAETAISAGAIATSIRDRLHPTKVIDVGCGNGAVLLAFQNLGIQGVGL